MSALWVLPLLVLWLAALVMSVVARRVEAERSRLASSVDALEGTRREVASALAELDAVRARPRGGRSGLDLRR
jgi:cytochrome c-type biogenesis protein CcmH/NrfF